MADHILINELPYCLPVKDWLKDRYGVESAIAIWKQVEENYAENLNDLPDIGRKNGHAQAVYGGMLIFALYPVLPDQPPISELEDFVQNLFMGQFTKLGKFFNLNRASNMWLIDKVFQKVGRRDRKDAETWPDGFINVNEPYDKEHHAARYQFTQCPNAEFAKKHNMQHILPLLCNSDFFGISEIHGQLIRCGTCGNSDVCDYLVVGKDNPLAKEYEVVKDDGGFLVSRKKKQKETA